MPSVRSEILRALEGVASFSGRTLVIEGPPMSGKTRLLKDLKAAVLGRGGRVVELRGSYRTRAVPYGALDGLRDAPAEEDLEEGSAELEEEEEAIEGPADAPMAPVAFNPDRLPRSRRGRGERPRGTFLGGPARARSANEGDPEEYWQELVAESRQEEGRPVLLSVDDAALSDPESRRFVQTLSTRARFRPLLIAVSLDTSVAGAGLWQEELLGRGDVDWIRLPPGPVDPREAHRLKEIFDDLPAKSKRVVGSVALLGGEVGEVTLSRVTRLGFHQLGEVLAPAAGPGLVKVTDGKVSIPHRAWVPAIPDLLDEGVRRSIHYELAEALGSLSQEPTPSRRVELARHYLEAGPGPAAIAHLLEAADLMSRVQAFDTAAELLSEAVGCLAVVPLAERGAIEPEIRLLYARALFGAGRPTEAEVEFREGMDGALRANSAPGDIAEWLEPLLLVMRVVGPRPTLASTLVDLAERFHDAKVVEVEVLLETLIADFHIERNQPARAREEALRAARLAHGLPERPLQAVGLLTMGFTRIEGTRAEQRQADRYLRAARYLLGTARRRGLDHLAGEYEARLLEAVGEGERALVLRQQAAQTLQRLKIPSLELGHQLALAEIALNRRSAKSYEPALTRAYAIVETLHLLPPSPLLLRYWLLDGRRLALADQAEPARDRWSAIADLPPAASNPRIRAEALARLTLLDFALGRKEAAEARLQLLRAPELVLTYPTAWNGRLPPLAEFAIESDLGGAAIPPPVSPVASRPRRDRQRREEPRSEAEGDRGRPDRR